MTHGVLLHADLAVDLQFQLRRLLVLESGVGGGPPQGVGHLEQGLVGGGPGSHPGVVERDHGGAVRTDDGGGGAETVHGLDPLARREKTRKHSWLRNPRIQEQLLFSIMFDPLWFPF